MVLSRSAQLPSILQRFVSENCQIVAVNGDKLSVYAVRSLVNLQGIRVFLFLSFLPEGMKKTFKVVRKIQEQAKETGRQLFVENLLSTNQLSARTSDVYKHHGL